MRSTLLGTSSFGLPILAVQSLPLLRCQDTHLMTLHEEALQVRQPIEVELTVVVILGGEGQPHPAILKYFTGHLDHDGSPYIYT